MKGPGISGIPEIRHLPDARLSSYLTGGRNRATGRDDVLGTPYGTPRLRAGFYWPGFSAISARPDASIFCAVRGNDRLHGDWQTQLGGCLS